MSGSLKREIPIQNISRPDFLFGLNMDSTHHSEVPQSKILGLGPHRDAQGAGLAQKLEYAVFEGQTFHTRFFDSA